jgi:hypothetical protein
MNRHQRRASRALIPKGQPDQYREMAEATVAAVRLWIADHPVPVFFFPFAIGLGSVVDHGHRSAQNHSAHELVRILVGLRDALDHRDYPTMMMLRVALENAGIQPVYVPAAELGYVHVRRGETVH